MMPKRLRRTLQALVCAPLLTSLLGACKGSADQAAPADSKSDSSVLVETTPPRREALPRTLTLYGEVAQEVGATENVSFARPVLISRLLVAAGERVHAGDPLLEVVTDPAAAAAFHQAQSAVTLAQKELASQQELFTERLTTQAQLAAARKSLADAQTGLNAQHQLGAAPGPQLVRASHDAVVASLTPQQGDRVQPGTTVMQLSKAGAQRAVLGAEPEDASLLAPGMPVRLMPVFGGGEIQAKIAQVYAVINPQTRLIDVSVHAKNPNPVLPLVPGMKLRGVITLAATDAWMVPHSAVLDDAQGTYVFQISGGHAKRVPVRVTVESDARDGITGAIDAKLPIVVSGNYELQDGAAIRTSGK
jgi:membrane fusion protein (multidrug efflux system)